MPILTAQHLQLITETAEALDNIETKIAELSYGTSADPQWSSKVNAIQATLQNIQEVANELKAYIAEPVVIEDLENVTRLTTSLKRTQQKVQLLQQRMIIPIRNYILQDNFPAVKTLFEKGEIFLEERDWQGDTLLLTAVRSGSTSIVEFLLKQGASLEAKNSQGDTAFTIAGQQRDKNLLNFLEKNKSIFGRDVNGETALHRAVRNGDLNAVTQLLKEGAFINAQNNQGETPLHILAATHGHIKMAKLLIEKGIDLALVDNKGDTALNKIVNPTAKKELTELLLRNRNQLSIRRLKNLIEVCRLHYVGDFESRVADEKLLNQAIQHLIGSIPDASNLNNKIMIADVMRSNLLVYLGHLISLKGNFTRDGLPGNFESSQVIYFLPLRARVLLEMIICIKKDFNDDYPGGYAEKQHVLDDLIDELAVTLEALHVRLGQWYVRYDLKCVDWGINAYTENIFDCIEKVMQIPGKSYVCDAGYTGHAVYAHFENHPDYPGKIIVRIDNLGEGNRHHDLRNQPHKNNTPGIKNLPHARVFPAQELRTPNSALNTCIRDALSLRFLKQSAGETDAAFKERVTMGLYGNSDPNITKADAARLKQAAIEQLYPWRGEQIVGNCVVKNWLVGMQIRLQQPKPANAPMVQNERWDHPLYHYFRVNELKYIPFKSYFEKKEAQKGPFALPDFASEKAMQAFHQSIAQDNIDKAKIQFGYTPLHLAVVSGE